jgi:hypothetical protein
MVESIHWTRIAYLMATRKQKGVIGMGQGQVTLFKSNRVLKKVTATDPLPSTWLYLPQFHHFPAVYSSFKFIEELNH